MKENEIETPEDLLAYILTHSDAIFVREQVEERRGSYSLSELPCRARARHILRFLTKGMCPVVVRNLEETENEE